jgi:very-short-patch-repair endonuclease
MTIEGVLRRQAGVISRTQALAGGLSSATIGRRLARGLWVRLHPGVYLAADHALTSEARLRAAYLWAGQEATLRGVTAAWWHGLWQEPPVWVEIAIPHRRRLSARPRVRVRRSDLHPADRVRSNGLWATAMPLTVLEAAVELGATGSQLLDRALQRRMPVADLYAAHCRNLGRHGSAAAAELLRATQDRAASVAERSLIGLVREAGLSGWRCGYRVGEYELDLAFPGERIAIEVDGWAWHSDVQRFRHDRRRQNTLVLAGWTVLRFTWHDLTTRPDAVTTEIRLALMNKITGLGS